jgi:peptide chain release factor 3
VVLIDPIKRKQLDAGLRQLTEEGAAQVFFTSPTDTAGPTPIVGAVGQLQFDVMLHRLEHEYGVRCRLERMAGKSPRWVTGPKDEIERVARDRGRSLIYDVKGNPVILFNDAWDLKWATEKETSVQWHEVAP